MSDICDDVFFRAHVWPLLLKDVRLMIADEHSNIAPTAVQAAAERYFVSRQYRLSALAGHGTARTPERENQVAGMQAYAHMYDFTITTTRDLIADEQDRLLPVANEEAK